MHTGIKLAAWATCPDKGRNGEAELFKKLIIAEGYAQPASKPGLYYPVGDRHYYAASFNLKGDS